MHTSRVSTARGFILQASYRVVSGEHGVRRTVVHLYGRLENGATFLVRDDRQRPHFYVRAADAERARALGAPAPESADRHTFAGAAACRLCVATPPDLPPLRDRLHANGIDTFEADVRFASRYLIERDAKRTRSSATRRRAARAAESHGRTTTPSSAPPPS